MYCACANFGMISSRKQNYEIYIAFSNCSHFAKISTLHGPFCHASLCKYPTAHASLYFLLICLIFILLKIIF